MKIMPVPGSISYGLTSQEAVNRLQLSGKNELPRKRSPSVISVMLKQFFSPLLLLLLFAGIFTFIVGEWLDSAVIFAAVLLNATLGFFQEYKALRILHSLSQILTQEATVIRDGEMMKIDAAFLVPGDVVVLEHGQKIPADGVVIKAEDIQVDESILTGESVPVQKHAVSSTQHAQTSFESFDLRKDLSHCVYMGTTMFSGFGRMIVSRIGKTTAVGTVAKDLHSMHHGKTPLQKRLSHLSVLLSALVMFIVILVIVLGFLKGYELRTLTLLAVALAVSAIPEGLALVLTSVLSLGMMRIFKKHGLVRSLVAAETLGSVDVICTDKTGTLTHGQLQLVDVVGDKDKRQLMYRAVCVASDMRDPLEHEIQRWIEKKGFSFSSMKLRYPRVSHLPFTLENRITATQTARHIFAFGAPEILLSKTSESQQTKKEILRTLDEYAGKGYRLIAVAGREKRASRNLTIDDIAKLDWYGIFVFQDQERQDIKHSLKRAKEAGAQIKVITGDFARTTLGLLQRLDWYVSDEHVCTGEQLEQAVSSKARSALVERCEVFARVTPRQKYLIVEALQQHHHVVAMMGDGVNDALALRKADISIVVRSSSDVAREIADLVLLNNSFSTVIAAIEEGRMILSQIQKILVFLLSGSFTEVVLVLSTILFGLPVPLTAIQILWINIVTDGPPSFALMFEQKDKGVLRSGPKNPDAPILSMSAAIFAGLVSLLTGVISFAVFLYFYEHSGLMVARTFTFFLVILFSLLYVFSVRSLQIPIWKHPLASNIPLLLTVCGIVIFQVLFFLSPEVRTVFGIAVLSSEHIQTLFVMSLGVVACVEVLKLGVRTLQTHPLTSS